MKKKKTKKQTLGASTKLGFFSVRVIQRAFQLQAILPFNGYQYVIATLFFSLAEITPLASFLTFSPLLQEHVPITLISCCPLPPSLSNYIMPK